MVVVACYTITSLSDKYAVAKLKFDGSTLAFLMAAATSVFMLFYLPFDSRFFTLTWQSFVAILLMTASKFFEFQFAAIILQEMSAFELKAWLGITLFMSYAADLITGTAALGTGTLVKFCFIAVTTAGLFLIARSGNEKINYAKIIFPLAAYLLSKFGYGLIVNLSQNYISPSLSLFFALIILAIVLAPKVRPVKLCKEHRNGVLFVALTKIPNVIGLICENIVAVRSMANYSFIQPMILVTLFIIQLIRREECTKLNIAGGIACIIGIVGFQIF